MYITLGKCSVKMSMIDGIANEKSAFSIHMLQLWQLLGGEHWKRVDTFQ